MSGRHSRMLACTTDISHYPQDLRCVQFDGVRVSVQGQPQDQKVPTGGGGGEIAKPPPTIRFPSSQSSDLPIEQSSRNSARKVNAGLMYFTPPCSLIRRNPDSGRQTCGCSPGARGIDRRRDPGTDTFHFLRSGQLPPMAFVGDACVPAWIVMGFSAVPAGGAGLRRQGWMCTRQALRRVPSQSGRRSGNPSLRRLRGYVTTSSVVRLATFAEAGMGKPYRSGRDRRAVVRASRSGQLDAIAACVSSAPAAPWTTLVAYAHLTSLRTLSVNRSANDAPPFHERLEGSGAQAS